MNIPDAVVNVAVALTGALVGGGITGYFTLKAADKAIREENAKELRRDEKEVQNLLDALGVEIKTLWGFHMRRVGQKVEELPDGQPLAFYYPLTQDYFTIYNSNAAMIGRIGDCELCEAIVICYNKCKKTVDGFKYNNELFLDYRALRHLPESQDNTAMIAVKHKELVDYARMIKEDHVEVKGYVERMLQLLEQRDQSA